MLSVVHNHIYYYINTVIIMQRLTRRVSVTRMTNRTLYTVRQKSARDAVKFECSHPNEDDKW